VPPLSFAPRRPLAGQLLSQCALIIFGGNRVAQSSVRVALAASGACGKSK
jgi:hypothetical protein